MPSRPKPGLAPGEAGGRAGVPAAVQTPGLAIGFLTAQGKGRRLGGKEGRLHADRPVVEPRRRGEVERLEEVAPTHVDLVLARPDDLVTNPRRRSLARKG